MTNRDQRILDAVMDVTVEMHELDAVRARWKAVEDFRKLKRG